MSSGKKGTWPAGNWALPQMGQLKGFGALHVCIPSDFPLLLLTIYQLGQKQYAKQTVYDAHLTSKKHEKAAAKLAAEGGAAANGKPHENGATKSSSASKTRQSARLTHLITTLLVPLLPTLAETKANVERRFSLTAREREEELVDDTPVAAPVDPENNAAEEEQAEEERIYNPLKLPLGWDGKPIPYWLYKLHGLGVEYRCEICSDYVYMGRKNFERHFQVSTISTCQKWVSNIDLGSKTCVRYARSGSTKYKALPRNYQNRRCACSCRETQERRSKRD